MICQGGFQLDPGQTTQIPAPANWSGRIWPRRDCSFIQAGSGTCQTGNCGGVLHCFGLGGSPPVTLAEFTLNIPLDYYDVNLVDGYNVPMSVTPTSNMADEIGSCRTIRCQTDVNQICPGSLQVVNQAGEYASPDKCLPTEYSKVFKDACPSAYTYAYDDPTSIFVCRGADYGIAFC